MEARFRGQSLRQARLFHGLSLEDVGDRVKRTRQYIHKLETGQSTPSHEFLPELADALNVFPDFFYPTSPQISIPEEHFHFRKLFTTRATVKYVAIAKAEVFAQFVSYLDTHLKLPPVDIPVAAPPKSVDDIERAAERCRRDWGLGLGPIANMVRLAESRGSIVTSFSAVSREVDALSISTGRPLIVLNDAKKSPCRHRFDVAHEIGHWVLHQGIVTGDRLTESEANRFAGALLIPRSMMMKLFPRPRGSRLDWRGLREFKLTWLLSKAALLYRARQLSLLTDAQYKTGVVTLKRNGEAATEREDELISMERPELISRALGLLETRKGICLADIERALGVGRGFLRDFVGDRIAISPALHLVSS